MLRGARHNRSCPGAARRETGRMVTPEQLWPPFALTVTAGPLTLQAVRDEEAREEQRNEIHR